MDNAVSALIKDVARTVIMPRYQNLSQADVSTKKHASDFVTIADTEAELALIDGLTKLLPGALVVGEEGYSRDPSILARLSQPGPVWVIDPIDGTRGFIEGQHGFTSMVALVENGDLKAGWIFDPLDDVMLHGRIGQGVIRNGQTVTYPAAKPLSAMKGRLRKDLFKERYKGHLETVIAKTAEFVRLPAAGDTFMALIDGRVDFALFRGGSNAWDVLPGLAILHAAGGRGTYETGQAYTPNKMDPEFLLLTRRAEDWTELQALLAPDQQINHSPAQGPAPPGV